MLVNNSAMCKEEQHIHCPLLGTRSTITHITSAPVLFTIMAKICILKKDIQTACCFSQPHNWGAVR